MDPYYLELYQDRAKIPDAFSALPGASAYDSANPAEYFGVLIPAPAAGSEQAAHLEPTPPDAAVAAWTHGTDTLPAGTASFAAASVCIWAPRTKSIPYKFDVFAPDGTHIALDPAPGTDDHAWFCAPVPDVVANAIGVWRVIVSLNSASHLPAVYPPRRAALNPDDLTFPPAEFERQPLVLINGPRRVCATLQSIAVTAGCAAPNQSVTLTADVLNPEHVVEWNWTFGDGSPSPAGAGQTVTHTYATQPTGPASLTIVREEGCTPRTQTQFVGLTPCNCPTLTGIEVVSGCAPGRITFRAVGEHLDAAEGFVWNFGDGETSTTTAPVASHDYAAGPDPVGSLTVSVGVVSPDNCPPAPPQSLAVPACCPRLTGVYVESGCAPGTVAFKAFGQNLGAATRFYWNFGDGTAMETDGPEASHPYAEAPTGPGTLYATVSMVAPANCPISAPQRTQVPGCPVTCPQILAVRIVSENKCAPGTVTFQADVDHPESVVEWNWLFGDGASSQDPVTTEHTYTSAGPFQASVSIRRDYRCRPIDAGPRYTTVSPCPEEKQERPQQVPWCLLLMISALGLFFLGHVMFTVGAAVMLLWPCFIDVAGALAVQTGGLSILFAIIIYFVFIVITFLGIVFTIAGVLLFVYFLFKCQTCDGISSPISMCELLRLAAFLLTFGTLAAVALDSVIFAAVSVVAGLCGAVWAQLWAAAFSALGLIPWLIDLGALAVIDILLYCYGNAIGCFNTWPKTIIPLIPLPAPPEDARCPDQFTS